MFLFLQFLFAGKTQAAAMEFKQQLFSAKTKVSI